MTYEKGGRQWEILGGQARDRLEMVVGQWFLCE